MLKETVTEFIDDDCMSMSAALAYYTVFSLPPLLLIIVVSAGFFFGERDVQQAIQGQIGDAIGQEASKQTGTMIAKAGQGVGGGISALIGILALLFGATTAFAQLQAALNRAWEVQPDPNAGGLRNFIGKRLMSFGMILAIAFLLLVSLVVTAAVNAAGGRIAGMLPFSASALSALQLSVSFVVIWLLFTAIFKYMPDAVIRWRDVAVGGAVTALLFVAGKFLLGFYFAKADVASSYGVAGSIILILLWIYYSSMILLFGAEFTQVWAASRGREIQPEPGAVRMSDKRPENRMRPKAAA